MQAFPPDAMLAIHGGIPAKQRPDPPMYPGGMVIDEAEEAAVLEVLRRKRLFRYGGPGEPISVVSELEEAFAAKKGVKYTQAVTSGTAALICALRALEVGLGDEVIIPAYTWIATATAVLAAGGVPIVAEVDETLLLDPVDFAAKITPYTKAVVVVHMRGAPAPMDKILPIAQKHGIKVVEDCAQANGATYLGQEVGTMGDAGAFSLQFNKVITSGEGGMVTTNSRTIWERVAMFHDAGGHGRDNLDDLLWGVNFRMPEVLGAIALTQLQKLDWLLAAMRARKQMIKTGIADVMQRKGLEFRRIADPNGDAAICTILYMHTPEQAEAVKEALRAENIGAARIYQPDKRNLHVYAHWTPILNKTKWGGNHSQWTLAQREIEYSQDMCPRTLDLLGRAVHLDVSPLLTNEDVEETVEGLNRVLNALT